MTEDITKRLEEARASGRFEGEVLTSLGDIKRVLEDMKAKHVNQDAKIDQKADRDDVESLKKRVWMLTGSASVLAIIIGKIIS